MTILPDGRLADDGVTGFPGAVPVAAPRLGGGGDDPTDAPTSLGTIGLDDDAGVTGGVGTGPRLPRDTGPLVVGRSFGPRYHIIWLIGLGGMGAVYQAWDAELGVVVA